MLKTINQLMLRFGFNGRQFLDAFRPKKENWIDEDLEELKRQKGADDTFVFGEMKPIFSDKLDQGGSMAGHYFHQIYLLPNKFTNQVPKSI